MRISFPIGVLILSYVLTDELMFTISVYHEYIAVESAVLQRAKSLREQREERPSPYQMDSALPDNDSELPYAIQKVFHTKQSFMESLVEAVKDLDKRLDIMHQAVHDADFAIYKQKYLAILNSLKLLACRLFQIVALIIYGYLGRLTAITRSTWFMTRTAFAEISGAVLVGILLNGKGMNGMTFTYCICYRIYTVYNSAFLLSNGK